MYNVASFHCLNAEEDEAVRSLLTAVSSLSRASRKVGARYEVAKKSKINKLKEQYKATMHTLETLQGEEREMESQLKKKRIEVEAMRDKFTVLQHKIESGDVSSDDEEEENDP